METASGIRFDFSAWACSFPRAIIVASVAILVPAVAAALTPPGQALVDSAQNPNQQSMAVSVANLCPQMSALNSAGPDGASLLSQSEQELFFRCREVLNATPDSTNSKPEVLEQLTSDELTAGQRATLNYGTVQRANIASRLLVIRRGSGATVAFNGGQDAGWLAAQGGAAGDAAGFAEGRLGIFINGSMGSGDKDQTDFESGYDVDTQSLTAGVDYRFSSSFVAGAAFGYGTSEADYDGGGGFDSDGINGSLYASFYGEHAYLNFLGSYGQVDHDLTRRIAYSVTCIVAEPPANKCPNQESGVVTVDANATGSTSSDIISLGADFGYALFDGPFSFTPMAAVSFVEVDLDGFSEKNAGSQNELALAYDSQKADSLELQFGFSAGYTRSVSWGVLAPYGRMMIVREMRDSRQVFDAHYVFDPCFQTSRCGAAVTDPNQTGIRIYSDKPDTGFYRWALGLSAVFANGFGAFAEYEGLADYDTVSYGVATVGVRYQFR